MKRKFLTTILCICFIIPAIFCLSACKLELDKKLTVEQVVSALKVVCRDAGYLDAEPEAMSSFNQESQNGITELGIEESKFKSTTTNLTNYIESNDIYSIYDSILKALANDISEEAIQLETIKKYTSHEGTNFEQDVYFNIVTTKDLIIIYWASADYVKHANTDLGLCIGYKLTIEYDFENFLNNEYYIRQYYNINVNGESDVVYVYQHIKKQELRDCGVVEGGYNIDEKGNIDTIRLSLENIDLVNNKACFMLTEKNIFPHTSPNENDIQYMTTDESLAIAKNISNKMEGLENLTSLIYTMFCTENNPFLQ